MAESGVDVPSSTNMSSGTCTNTCIGELATMYAIGGALGLVASLAGSVVARCACVVPLETLTTGTGGTDLGEIVSEHSHVGVNVAEAGVVVPPELIVLSCAVCESDDSSDECFESVDKSVKGEIRCRNPATD